MANPSKQRGDRAERELSQLLSLLLGQPIRRKLGAGRLDDVGDLDGLDGFTLQVADWADVARAAREKPLGAERQRRNACSDHATTFVRFRGGSWRCVLTPEQWARLVLLLDHQPSAAPSSGAPTAAADRSTAVHPSSWPDLDG